MFRAEMLKLSTVYSTRIAIIAGLAGLAFTQIIMFWVLPVAAVSADVPDNIPLPNVDTGSFDFQYAALNLVSGGAGSGSVAIALIAILAIGILSATTDYRSGGMTAAALAQPSRGRILVGKAAALRERAELAERDRDRNAQEAIRQERNLIARELHDIAAHHLTGIMLSTQAVSSLMATDPEKAREYLSTVQVEARTALDNVRQTVGLLRTDDETDLAPAPTYNDLAQLIEDHRARGTLIALDTTGDPMALGPIAGNAVYRTVQGALANAAKHAPGSSCSVRVVWASDSLNVVIENGPAIDPVPDIPSDGYGLLGIRECARLVHGTLDAEPRVDGGWRTELKVPYPDNMAWPDPLGETSLPGSDR